jgi:hypothetical protein
MRVKQDHVGAVGLLKLSLSCGAWLAEADGVCEGLAAVCDLGP